MLVNILEPMCDKLCLAVTVLLLVLYIIFKDD